ncbi:MAG: 2-oxo-4-hydroxy-4-carboxy-5-ureidoimidazoline decarboxylase [Elusimicrobia bacterium]|nr:2-oxo-4-hydroxy-4-carboxy-5-ureidoimidazoline decarboxylase [Elusimicrobiota bacterium]
MTLDELNRLPEAEALDAFRNCCGSSRWAREMVFGRPYAAREALLDAADQRWAALSKPDRLEAFDHHPRIGERQLREKFGATAAWAGQEQSGVKTATEDVLAALAQGNRDYERRFGHIFLVCATGKGAAELLAILRRRMANEPEAEFAEACGEQAKITRLRLEKLLS